MKTNKLQTAQQLREAARLITEVGFIRGDRGGEQYGGYCALGAIDRAITGRDNCFVTTEDTPAVVALSEMIPMTNEELGPDRYNRRTKGGPDRQQSRIATWNNIHCKSGKDVACMMQATAEFLEEQAKEEGDGA